MNNTSEKFMSSLWPLVILLLFLGIDLRSATSAISRWTLRAYSASIIAANILANFYFLVLEFKKGNSTVTESPMARLRISFMFLVYVVQVIGGHLSMVCAVRFHWCKLRDLLVDMEAFMDADGGVFAELRRMSYAAVGTISSVQYSRWEIWTAFY